MRSGQLAAAAGVNRQTLRYYERRGLLPEPDRSLGGHREYGDDAVLVLRAVKAAQRLGFTLDEIADLLAVRRPGLRSRAREKLAEVDVRIADLQTVRATLVEVIDTGCADLAECAGAPACPIPFAGPGVQDCQILAAAARSSPGTSPRWTADSGGHTTRPT